MLWIQGAPDDNEYDWCHKFATASSVGENLHFTVAMLPVGNPNSRELDAYPGESKSYRVGEVVDELLKRVTSQISVDQLVADREFFAADSVTAAEAHGVRYVIPVPRNKRIKRELARAPDQVLVKDEYPIHGPVKGQITNTRVETTLVILPAEDNRERDDPAPFITNSEVRYEISLDRRETKQKIQRYNRRGGIKNTYKKIKEFAAWTTSKEFEVRLFHFGFAVLLYNMWLLVDFLVQVAIYDEFRYKTGVTADRFMTLLDRRLVTLL